MAASRTSGRSAAASRSRRAASRPKRYGCETPRIWTPPKRKLIQKTSLGFECIKFAEEVLGIELLPWQKWLLKHALELNPDGSFRFRTVILLVARQNGKSTLLQVLALWRMYLDGGRMVIGTAQSLDIADEVWQGAVDMAQDVPELAAEVAKIDLTKGRKALHLRSGQRYKVQSASRRGGRGLSGELVELDELREHQSWDAWGAVTKTTMARDRAQVWGASNAGDASSIVLRYLRKMAHDALGDPDGLGEIDSEVEPDETVGDEALEDEDTLGIFEWSAPPGCGIWDRDGWAQADPSMGYTITERAIASAAKTDPEWIFRTEVLCQWSDGTLEGPFPPGAWEASKDEGSVVADDSPVRLCVDVSWDRSTAHVGLAGWRADGVPHVEVIASRAGTDWVAGWLTDERRSEKVKMALREGVAVQARGAPASSLVDPLRTAGVEVTEWSGSEHGRACGDFYDRVRQAVGEGAAEVGLRHRGQPLLDVAAATATTRPASDAWWWDRKNSPTDIAPLVAVTGALWALQPKPVKTKTPRVHEWPEELLEVG